MTYKPGILKPFAGLKKDELQGELRVRGVFYLSGKKDERQCYRRSCVVHKEFRLH